MFRRVCSITFVLAISVLVGCGHQVTPNPTAAQSDLGGDIVVKFQTSGALDFNNVTYVIAIDMCGTSVPYPMAFYSGYASYTYSFLVGGGTGSTALPELIQYYLPQSSNGLTKLQVPLNANNTSFVVPFQGAANEFEFIFPRSDLNEPFKVAQPCPNSTVAPSASPSAAATATPSASASAGATPAASPTPSPTGSSDATGVDSPPYLTSWTFNLMTFAANGGVALDSLGLYGPSDTTFSGIVVDTTTTNTYTSFRQPPNAVPQNAAAYITYGEIDTYAGQ